MEMKFGQYQRKIHALLEEVFDSRSDAYKYLHEKYGVKHFSQITPNQIELLRKIYDDLYVRSITELTP